MRSSSGYRERQARVEHGLGALLLQVFLELGRPRTVMEEAERAALLKDWSNPTAPSPILLNWYPGEARWTCPAWTRPSLPRGCAPPLPPLMIPTLVIWQWTTWPSTWMSTGLDAVIPNLTIEQSADCGRFVHVEASDQSRARRWEASLGSSSSRVEVRVHRHARKDRQAGTTGRIATKPFFRVEAPRGLQLLDGTRV